ncbi:hypothetical protein FH972_003944 [Carpinus fangiana]|uniref:Uncharacterized protein n=1 Tax=Carpinus fangiana TaxID=176857 RepID=A0A5N6QJT7_9ROSI|nr:hypothetical protein FH972_003944 [Carpinus fangiana]
MLRGRQVLHHLQPRVSRCTKATLTINSFEKGGDGGGPSECDGQYHSDNTPMVAPQQDGSTISEDVQSILPSTAMEGVLRPRWLMSVTLPWDVMLSMTTSLHVLTIFSKMFGRPWECHKMSGED